MYRIYLQKTSKKEFDEVIEIEEEMKASNRYCKAMKEEFYFGRLVEVIDGKEQNRSSFCNSEYARSNE